MEHWNKGGLSREEFLRMREDAMRKLQELAKKQASRPERPAEASAPPNGAHPHLQKPEAALATPVPKEPFKDQESESLLDKTPAKSGSGELSPLRQERQPMDLPNPERPKERQASVAATLPNLAHNPAEKADTEEHFHYAAPPETPQKGQTDAFMPSEDLLQTIQDISQAMGSTVPPHADPPKAFVPDKEERSLEEADVQLVPDPPAAQTISAEPVFVPPLPYHPDGFIPRKPKRGPSFHPDAVRPEKGCYQPPRPTERPPYHPENHWEEENPKKKIEANPTFFHRPLQKDRLLLLGILAALYVNQADKKLMMGILYLLL